MSTATSKTKGPISKRHTPSPVNRVWVVGCGGTGSYLARGLAKMVAGYRLDVAVTLMDGDTVEDKNILRQNFFAWEVGQNKAECLALRLNGEFGTRFGAVPSHAQGPYHGVYGTLVVTCVDTVSARKRFKTADQWLDVGNDRQTGQAVYGTTADEKKIAGEKRRWAKTPAVTALPNPYLKNGLKTLRDRKGEPSCAENPFAEQGVFVNEMAATAALTIVHQIVVLGEVTTPAIYFDADRGRMNPATITREYLAV